MAFFKRIFGGGGGSSASQGEPAHLLSVYVQPSGCDEVVLVRINLHNDLSQTDDGTGYWVRKMVMGTTCFKRVELEFTFDSNRRIRERQITGGALVDADAYAAWQASRPGSTP